jgi:hypothetical protein
MQGHHAHVSSQLASFSTCEQPDLHGRRASFNLLAAQVHMSNLRYMYHKRPGWQATPRRPTNPCLRTQDIGMALGPEETAGRPIYIYDHAGMRRVRV